MIPYDERACAVELPEASIVHRTERRLRIKIESRRGDAEYFSHVCSEFLHGKQFGHPQANRLTGSLLFADGVIEPAALANYALSRRLFRLRLGPAEVLPVMHRMVSPAAAIDRGMRSMSGGMIDLPSGVFLALLGVGLYQLARGRLSAPPWYTAFWYAFGIISMVVMGKTAEKGREPAAE